MTTQPGRPFAVDDDMDEDAGPAVSRAHKEERGDAESDVIVAEVIDEEPGSRTGGYEPGAQYGHQPGAPYSYQTGDSYQTGADSEPVAEAATEDPLTAAEYGDAVSPPDEALSSDEAVSPEDAVSLDDALSPANVSPATAIGGSGGMPGNGALGQQWHDIQAMFVDDPRGSVQLAAEAAEVAVSSLVDSLRERQADLRPPAVSAEGADRSDTEQLREALRTYRTFCEAIRDLTQRLPQVGGVGH